LAPEPGAGAWVVKPIAFQGAFGLDHRPMRTSIGHRVRSVVAIVAMALLGSCAKSSTVTQIVVRIDLEPTLKVPCAIDSIDIEVPGVEDSLIEEYSLEDNARLPIQITLIDGPTGPFDIVVVGRKAGQDAPVLEQVVTLPGFVSGKSKLALVKLDSACGSDCEPQVISAAELADYAPIGDTYAAARCDVVEICGNGIDDDNDGDTDNEDSECVTCTPVCAGDEECFAGVCRTLNVVRYETKQALSAADDACQRPDKEVLLVAGDGVDAAGYVPIYNAAPTGENPSMDFFFYGRRVHGVWIGVDGWMAFDFDPGQEASPPALGVGGDRNKNQPLDAAGVPAGIYPFWHGLQLRTTNSEPKVCVWKDQESASDPVATQLQIGWNLGCFNESSSCPGDTENPDKIHLRVVLDAADLSEDRLWERAGRIQIGLGGGGSMGLSQLSTEYPELAIYGRDPENDLYVTMGLKDVAPAACEAHTGDIADGDTVAIAQKCNVFTGRCPGTNVPCGFSQYPDPFYSVGDQVLMESSAIIPDTTPLNEGASIYFYAAGP
jgi:hypothetical protein